MKNGNGNMSRPQEKIKGHSNAPKPQYNFPNLKSELRIEDKIRACEAKSSL